MSSSDDAAISRAVGCVGEIIRNTYGLSPRPPGRRSTSIPESLTNKKFPHYCAVQTPLATHPRPRQVQSGMPGSPVAVRAGASLLGRDCRLVSDSTRLLLVTNMLLDKTCKLVKKMQKHCGWDILFTTSALTLLTGH